METFWVTVLTSGLTASIFGFVQFLITRHDNKKQQRNEWVLLFTEAIVGLGHDRILYLASKYIERGSISQAEYENIVEYLYKPYHKLGGNGSAERLIEEVKRLPIRENKDGN